MSLLQAGARLRARRLRSAAEAGTVWACSFCAQRNGLGSSSCSTCGRTRSHQCGPKKQGEATRPEAANAGEGPWRWRVALFGTVRCTHTIGGADHRDDVVLALAFSPCGRLLCHGTKDTKGFGRSLRLWSVPPRAAAPPRGELGGAAGAAPIGQCAQANAAGQSARDVAVKAVYDSLEALPSDEDTSDAAASGAGAATRETTP